jgi:hypothetical protein
MHKPPIKKKDQFGKKNLSKLKLYLREVKQDDNKDTKSNNKNSQNNNRGASTD